MCCEPSVREVVKAWLWAGVHTDVSSASLTKLGLRYNRLGDEGTITICKALSESKVSKLQELDLRGNDIGPRGGKALGSMLLVHAEL
eukprot:CAMPEP_0174716076 /NCGR_PEP_ID=MMETSP1094-20130205/22776_1 /TAXON_ID=156173 /ORGANISM="Chrysochromulina brevifilum, Strain UTEX LB 985" /LENGTH=86 /DNA_ID=CAMNT_0015915753 /DNA_START=90 /DNA_END=347 /DNA_ORIENTATION=+